MNARHRRPLLYLLTTVLAVATALALFGTAMTIGAARVADPRPVATETVVRAFYFAVNETIRTGDAATLDGVVAEELSIHGGSEALAPGRSGLARYLRSLHDTSSDVEIDVDHVIAADDRAIAYLAVRGGEGSFFGISPRGSRDVWGRIDGLRVVGHRVVELWSGAPGLSLIEPLRQITHDLAIGGRQVVVLDRLILPPDAQFEMPGDEEHRLIYVADGFVEGTMASGALAPGDFVALPTGAKPTLRAIGSVPATLLVTTIATPALLGEPYASSRSPRHEFRPLADDVPEGMSQDRTFADGVVLQSLAGGVVSTIPSNATVAAIGRATLLPGATLPAFDAPGPVLFVVEAGVLGVQATGGKVWVKRAMRGWGNNLDASTLNAGDGALLHAETAVNLRNDGSEPVVVLFVVLLPGTHLVT